jgi:heme/copper-type cytochrome/quinol oxidase subunit 4
MLVGIVLGIAMLLAVVYVAVSKKSSFTLRIAALVALGVMIVTVIICLFMVLGTDQTPKGPFLPDAPPVEELPPSGSNYMVLLLFVLFLVGLFLMVLLISMREHRKSENERIRSSMSRR